MRSPRWHIVIVTLLLAAIAPTAFVHVAEVSVSAALSALSQLAGGHG
jgi:hypothetical protein